MAFVLWFLNKSDFILTLFVNQIIQEYMFRHKFALVRWLSYLWPKLHLFRFWLLIDQSVKQWINEQSINQTVSWSINQSSYMSVITVRFGYDEVEYDMILWYIACSTAVTEAEHNSDIKPTTDTPYLALMGELWGVYCEDLGENWLCYNGTTLYGLSWQKTGWNQLSMLVHSFPAWTLHPGIPSSLRIPTCKYIYDLFSLTWPEIY